MHKMSKFVNSSATSLWSTSELLILINIYNLVLTLSSGLTVTQVTCL